MEGITARQQFTLNKILNEESISLRDLHKQLEVSDRTILREISSINKFLKKYHLSIYYDNSNLLSISGNKEKIEELKESQRSVPLQWLLNKEQRQIIIACELLINKEPVKASYYSNKFNVVLGSISLDLENIEKWALPKKLCLIRNRNIGIIIEGSEWNKRNALLDLIFKYRPYEELLAFLYEQKFDQNIKLLFNIIFGENITTLGRKILENADLSQFDLNDIKYLKLFIQILVAIKKAENKDEIHLPDKVKKDTMLLEDYKKIKNFDKILKENNVNLIEDELIYMWFNLTDYKSLFNRDDESSYINYEAIAKEVAERISGKINETIENDTQLIKDLSEHFRRTFNVLNLGLKVINPLAYEIEQHYSELFNVVNSVSRLVFSRYNLKIPKEEVGYITLHIDVALQRKQILLKKLNVLIVCPSGIGSARILGSKIKFIFPDIGSISIKTLHDIDKYIESSEYDLILSTVSINSTSEIKKVIVVSPFMDKEDIKKINEFILNLKVNIEQIILETDLITTSIGANNLKSTGKLLKDLLMKRFKEGKNTPLDIIACENALFATNILKEPILEGANEDFKNYIEKYVGFPNSAVDRIVPNVQIDKELPIDVAVEDFYEWDVEKNSVKINKNIKGADYVDNLEPYLERKLFLLNGAHAATAYIGYLKGYKYIHEAIKDEFIRNIAIGFHKEAIQALSEKHNLSIEDLNKYSKKLIRRFENAYLKDELYRVGRDPIRKLSSKDRLVTPLKLCYNLDMKYDNILYGIAAGFLFNYNEDEKAKQIQKSISEKGIENAISDVTGLKENDLVDKIENKYMELVNL